MEGLTKKQRMVLDFIIRCGEKQDHPTYRNIADHFDITVKGAYDHVDALRKKGYVELRRGESRNIRVLKDA